MASGKASVATGEIAALELPKGLALGPFAWRVSENGGELGSLMPTEISGANAHGAYLRLNQSPPLALPRRIADASCFFQICSPGFCNQAELKGLNLGNPQKGQIRVRQTSLG